MAHKIEAVLYDMDGTLLLTEQRNKRVNENTAKKYGGKIKKTDWTFLAGTSERRIYQHLSDTFNHFASKISEADYISEVEAGFITDRKGVILRPGMAEVFQRVADRGIIEAVVTNSPRALAMSSLDYSGLTQRMKLILTKDDVLAAGLKTKPEPDPYLLAAQQLGVNIENVLILEDSHNGTHAGVRALANKKHGAVIQLIDAGDEAQFHSHACKHARNRDQLIAAVTHYIS